MEWDCQDYVIEMIEALAKECIVDEESSSYEEAMGKLKKKRGGDV